MCNIGSNLKEISYNDFILKEKLGSGSSGYVHKCIYKETGEIVALKYVSCDDKVRRNQIIKEISFFLHHDCVAYIFAIF